jgi:hypothetical protein
MNPSLRTSLFRQLRRGFNFGGADFDGIPAEWAVGMVATEELTPVVLMENYFAPGFMALASAAADEYLAATSEQRVESWLNRMDTLENKVYSNGALSLLYGFTSEVNKLPNRFMMNYIPGERMQERYELKEASCNVLSPYNKAVERFGELDGNYVPGSPYQPRLDRAMWTFDNLTDCLCSFSVIPADAKLDAEVEDSFDASIGFHVDALIMFDEFQTAQLLAA